MKNIFLSMLVIVAVTSFGCTQQKGPLQVGDTAPDFTVSDYAGEMFTLSEHFDKGPVVLLFYRGGWCLFCQKQLKEFQSSMPEFEQMGATVVALSVDKVSKSAETVIKHDISFSLISDPPADVISNYGLRYIIPEGVNADYVNEYNIDIVAASGRTDRLVSMPAIFLIDKGEILYANVSPDPKVRIKTEDVMAEFRRILSERG